MKLKQIFIMGIFNKKPKRTIFRIIEFVDKYQNVLKVHDYPEELPFPRFGEHVWIDSRMGKVIKVVHNSSGNLTEIKAIVKSYA